MLGLYALALNLGHTKNGLGQREQQKALKILIVRK